MNSTQCMSIKHITEPQTQCYMSTKNNKKYCEMHSIQKNIQDYVNLQYLNDNNSTSINSDETIHNTILKTVTLNHIDADKKKKVDNKVNVVKNVQNISHKLLILANEDFDSQLIGPVYNDVTLSEDDQDPITCDIFWTMSNNMKIPSAFNKYYLFSYVDIHDKIRCLTVFTLHDIIKSGNYVHPITMDPMPEVDIVRANQLIEVYDSKLNLFANHQDEMSPEFLLKTRTNTIFNGLHTCDIYIEEKWFTQIVSYDKLMNVIKKTHDIIKNNVNAISTLRNGQLMEKNTYKLPFLSYESCRNTKDIIHVKNYIVDEWEKMIDLHKKTENPISIWILLKGLSQAVPEIETKYQEIVMFD